MFLAAIGAFDTLRRSGYSDGTSIDLECDLVAALLAVDVFRLHAILPGLEYAPISTQRGINRAGRPEAERVRLLVP